MAGVLRTLVLLVVPATCRSLTCASNCSLVGGDFKFTYRLSRVEQSSLYR